MEVGPIADGRMRVRFLQAAKKAGFSFYEKDAFKETAKFTRIVSKIKKLRFTEEGQLDDSPDYIKKTTEGLWRVVLNEGQKIVEVVRDFDWGGDKQ